MENVNYLENYCKKYDLEKEAVERILGERQVSIEELAEFNKNTREDIILVLENTRDTESNLSRFETLIDLIEIKKDIIVAEVLKNIEDRKLVLDKEINFEYAPIFTYTEDNIDLNNKIIPVKDIKNLNMKKIDLKVRKIIDGISICDLKITHNYLDYFSNARTSICINNECFNMESINLKGYFNDLKEIDELEKEYIKENIDIPQKNDKIVFVKKELKDNEKLFDNVRLIVETHNDYMEIIKY